MIGSDAGGIAGSGVMASVRKQIRLDASADAVWDAIRDFGAVPARVVLGFVVDTRLEGNDRIVTFFTGAVQREPLVALDDEARRLAYTAVDSPIGATHYNASVQSSPTARSEVASNGMSTSYRTSSPPHLTSSWTERQR